MYIKNLFRLVIFSFITIPLSAKDGYKSLMPNASEIEYKPNPIPNLGKLLKDDFNVCLNMLNQELTHHQKREAKSGTIGFQIQVKDRKVVKIDPAYDQFKDRYVHECVTKIIQEVKIPESYTSKEFFQNLELQIACDFKTKEKIMTDDQLFRECKIYPL